MFLLESLDKNLERHTNCVLTTVLYFPNCGFHKLFLFRMLCLNSVPHAQCPFNLFITNGRCAQAHFVGHFAFHNSHNFTNFCFTKSSLILSAHSCPHRQVRRIVHLLKSKHVQLYTKQTKISDTHHLYIHKL